MVCSLYNLEVDPTDNTAPNNTFVVAMGGWLTIDWISFPRESVYRPLLRNGCLSAYCIATTVLVVHFEVSAQQRVYTPQYLSVCWGSSPVLSHPVSVNTSFSVWLKWQTNPLTCCSSNLSLPPSVLDQSATQMPQKLSILIPSSASLRSGNLQGSKC
jgi:hypothetical protein